MKSTGIVRKIDELGRFVLPVELRRTLGIEIKDEVEIFVDGNKIVLCKYEKSCIFCGSRDAIKSFNDKNICASCIKSLK